MMHRISKPSVDSTSTQVLLVLDVVESVRLMEQDQKDFVSRWQQLVRQAEQMLPLYGGRIVKSLGDGLMLEFAEAKSCVQAAFTLQQLSIRANSGRRSEQQIHLRMGGHLASFVTDQHDIYGTDVNLTSRMCTLAGPNEVVVSVALSSQLVNGTDAEIEDLGEAYLKHIEKPVRAYRVTPLHRADRTGLSTGRVRQRIKPNVAVIPFTPTGAGINDTLVGDVLADSLSSALSRVPDLDIASNQLASSSDEQEALASECNRSHIDYIVVSSSTRALGQKLTLMTELIETRTGQALWSAHSYSTEQEILEGGERLISGLVAQLWVHIMRAEIRRTSIRRDGEPSAQAEVCITKNKAHGTELQNAIALTGISASAFDQPCEVTDLSMKNSRQPARLGLPRP